MLLKALSFVLILVNLRRENSTPMNYLILHGYSSAINCVVFHSYSSRDYNSRDSRDYGPPPRDYSYREYSNSSSRDDYGSMSRGYGYDSVLIQSEVRSHLVFS